MRGDSTQWIEFDIHDYARMRVHRSAPTAALMAQMFEPFAAKSLNHHDLTITGQYVPMRGSTYGSIDIKYTANSVYMNHTDVQIVCENEGFMLNGRRELLVMAIPLIDRILVTRGAAMIHAATITYRGQGVCLPAWGETGKTSTIAKLLRLNGVAFMGDDWAFLSQDGQLLGYQKPIFIKPHHRHIYPHLFKGIHKPVVPASLTGTFNRLSTLAHPVITKHPRVARLSRRWWPEHMIVTPKQAFPMARFASAAPLALVVFLERHDGPVSIVQPETKPWLVSMLIGNFHQEIGPYSRDVIAALAAAGLVPLERVFAEKAAVLERALGDTPIFRLRVPKALSADQASNVFVRELQQLFDRLGLAPGEPTGGAAESVAVPGSGRVAREGGL